MDKKEKKLIIEIVQRLSRIEENLKWIRESTKKMNNEMGSIDKRVFKLEKSIVKTSFIGTLVKIVGIPAVSAIVTIITLHLVDLW